MTSDEALALMRKYQHVMKIVTLQDGRSHRVPRHPNFLQNHRSWIANEHIMFVKRGRVWTRVEYPTIVDIRPARKRRKRA